LHDDPFEELRGQCPLDNDPRGQLSCLPLG